jgi:hypothetical protein
VKEKILSGLTGLAVGMIAGFVLGVRRARPKKVTLHIDASQVSPERIIEALERAAEDQSKRRVRFST